MSAPVKYAGVRAFAKTVAGHHFHRPPNRRPAAYFENPCQINGLAKSAVNCAFHPRIAAPQNANRLAFSPPPVAAT